jgi:outer membrane protein TolC
MGWNSSRVLLAMLVFSIASAPQQIRAREPAPATLQELVRQAVRTHEAVQLADSRVRRADADIALTSSALLPRLELNGAYTFYADEQVIELSEGESFVIRPAQDWSGSVDLRQTLFYGLRDWRARDIARLNRDIAELDRVTTVNELSLQVARAFYDAVALGEWVEVRTIVLE